MKKLLDRLKAYASLGELFGVLSVISLNRLRRARQKVYPQVPYFRRLEEVLEHLFYLYPTHPLFSRKSERRTTVILFGSDLSYTKSLCTRLYPLLERVKPSRLVIFGEKCVNRRITESIQTRVVGNVFGKNLEFTKVNKVVNELFEEYRSNKVDRILILYARASLSKGKRYTYSRGRKVIEEEIPRQILYERKGAKPVKSSLLDESLAYEILLLPFLPPPVKGRYRKEEILNLEGSEEELISQILKLYLNFYVKFLMLEHYTVLNLVRFRNTKRMQDNVEKKIRELKLLISKMRQEKITREIEDIVFGMLASEDRVLRDFSDRFAVLEIGKEVDKELREKIVKTVKKYFPLQEIKLIEGMLGFRIITSSRVYDFSVGYYLDELKKRLTSGVDLF